MAKMFTPLRLTAALAVAALLPALLLAAPPADADPSPTEFSLEVYHGINGRSLGLDKDLAVDVYANGGLFYEDLTFKTRLQDILVEEGEYLFEVWLADSGPADDPEAPAPLMSLDAGFIPAGAQVFVHAKLGAGKTPELKARVK